MTRLLRPGWLVVFFALVVSASAWMPWLRITRTGGWANAAGGAHGNLALPPGFGAGQLIVLLSSSLLVVGAMVGCDLAVRFASIAALIISLLIVALTVWYYQINVNPPVLAEYGLYLGAAGAICAAACAVPSIVAALASGPSRR